MDYPMVTFRAMASLVEPPNGIRQRGKHYYSMWQTLFEIDTKYVPIKPIGRGAYGVVCSSINRETNEKVAIKKIHNVFENRIDALRTLRELKLLRHIRHDNVIALKDVMMPIQRTSFKDVYLVYELMDTDLHQIIKSPQPLSNDHCKYFLFQLKFCGRKPIFPGTECLNQLKLIINVLGSPHEADIEFVDNPKARKYIKSLPYSRGMHSFPIYIPNADPLAIDLLQRMLVFDPTMRITVTEALQHPYMSGLYDPRNNPPAQVPINLDIDENLGEHMIREMMWNEMLLYHPEAASANA
ncbi:Mitogen-activated protein kinase 7 [Morella rubra]|uniref:mitogen-activated protein kinase n=1 Tax=Morella rubra TaxID=262757 RepID=A0A6A1UQ91_9ROSI|nr:Mitogen-activated protein kinase 7 [Morella rubra]